MAEIDYAMAWHFKIDGDPRNLQMRFRRNWAAPGSGTVFDGTQRGLLELLFGAGIMIMTRAAMKPRGSARPPSTDFNKSIGFLPVDDPQRKA